VSTASSSVLLVNGRVVNDGVERPADVLISGQRIARVDAEIAPSKSTEVIDLDGAVLMPGMIDDQVHFREPGLTHKGDFYSESRAAVAGGITSYLDMPNNKPTITTRQRMVEKYALAEGRSFANYGFYFGASNDNLEEIRALQPNEVCGVKVFMGASTGNMLVDDEATLEGIFGSTPLLVATHCEDTPMILVQERAFKERYGDDVPMAAHPAIRSAEACYKSSSMAVGLARRHGTRLHVLHLTTARELELFDSGAARSKQITAEACVHHLWFDESRYADKGTLIKCNPAIKTEHDRLGLLAAVRDGVIDIIATDHAPHTLEEKSKAYFEAPAGLPLVQDALLSLLEHHHRGDLSLPLIAEKTAHAPADLFAIPQRGYVREGYFADLVAVDLKASTNPTRKRVLSKCGWSPFEGETFNSQIRFTMVNGSMVYDHSGVAEEPVGQRLQFEQRW
jgi:dihydroorotase